MKHILIVEDEQHLAIGIKYNLEAEGYYVTNVSDGPSALALFEEDPQSIDLVILDLMMPGMSGYAVCQKLREDGHDVPILMLTARTLTEDRIRGWDVGTDQYLQKPFDLEELLSVVRNLLARHKRILSTSSARLEESVFAFGRAKVNFDTFEVYVDGQRLHLSSLYMKLLRYFAEHEGSVVTRAELLENVWGMSRIPTTRTVDNFIVNLRKFFEVDPANPQHFLSVRGTGYRFIAAPENTKGTAEKSLDADPPVT